MTFSGYQQHQPSSSSPSLVEDMIFQVSGNPLNNVDSTYTCILLALSLSIDVQEYAIQNNLRL